MLNNELKISLKDWTNILIIGILFGFFQSLIFYFLNQNLQTFSTIIFSISTAFFITIFAIILITLSNSFILPKIKKSFWTILSFFFLFFIWIFRFYFNIFYFF